MSLMEKDKFDQIFDEAFDEAAKNLTTPDPTASWNRIENRLKRRSKRRTWLHILPYLVASFILGAAIFGTPTSTKAFSPIFQHMKSFKNDVVSFIFGSLDTTNTKPKTAPPPDASEDTSEDALGGLDIAVGQSTEKHYRSWAEVTQHNVFPPVAIEYIPDGFKQSDIILFFKSTQETATKAVLLFTNEANERFILKMDVLGRNETITSNNDTANGTLETIPIHDSEAYLFVTADDRKILEYLYTNMHISISGSLSKEDLIKIAENIKKREG